MQTIFEKSVPGRSACQLPKSFSGESELDSSMIRDELDLPEVSELDLMRHYTKLSKRAFGVDDGFYPLGSCTMKYNPRINEAMARLPEFANFHPWDDNPDYIQGNLELINTLENYLSEVTGFPGLSLQPAAGAHGELTAVMMMKAYHNDRKDFKRNKIIIPDSAHGTNPATVSMCGYETVELPSDENGYVDLEKLKELVDEETVGLMLTIPNTVGLFDKNILEISRILHEKGALLYMDGANLNAILGIVKPAEMGVDIMHINLHKTFSTPHGGGGPGGGFVGCTEDLKPYLPAQAVVKNDKYAIQYNDEKSIGRVRAFFSNFGILVRAFTYVTRLGKEGTSRVGRIAVLNANYIKARLKEHYNVAYDVNCMHEVVFNDEKQQKHHVSTMDIAKRLIDFGYHPPTIYFPLLVQGALMVEPTETESKQTIDEFIDAMIRIAKEAEEKPEMLQRAPHRAPVKRVDAVKAARNPVVVCNTCCT